MENDRRQRYLETLLQGRAPTGVRELIPVVSRWNEILSSVPGLHRRHPGAHSRIADLRAGVLTVEADHPAWLQLLQWHQGELVERLSGAFPTLGIRALQFRLSRPGEAVERPNVVMPDPVKPELSPGEQAQLDAIIADLEALIRKKSREGENSV
jgi:predicted nucleic acid-binding Zn ribbon protein